MASLASIREPACLSSMPTEIHREIITLLEIPDILTLRLTNRHFNNPELISPPTHADLLTAERAILARKDRQNQEVGFWDIDLLTCAGCIRLRRSDRFSSKMRKKKKRCGGHEAKNRFCFECGRKPLTRTSTDKHRYQRGGVWDEHGVSFVRCSRCKKVRETYPDSVAGVYAICLRCHQQDLEREKASDELARVQKELKRKAEKAERKRLFYETRYASESFPETSSEEEDPDEEARFWCNYEEDAMNYSNCS